MSDYIPPELLTDVLKKLPVEDLGRCLIVCKKWYSLITSPSFISLHSQNQSSPTNIHNKNRLLLVRSSPELSFREIYSIRIDNDTFEECKSLNFRLKSNNEYFRVIGCFNGVVCLYDNLSFYANSFILWNPSIRKYVTLPEPARYVRFKHSIGFAFCAASNDFKVVRVFHVSYDKFPKLEVYSLSKGCWTRVDPKGFPHYVHPLCPQAYLNGAVHWTGSSHSHKSDGFFNMIVSFDMGTEELGVIEMPHPLACADLDLTWGLNYRVSVLEELLSLINLISSEDFKYVCDIWVMKDYGKPESWTKLFTIDLHGGLAPAIGFLRNGRVLVIDIANPRSAFELGVGCELASYDPKSKQVKHIGINGDATAFCVDYFVETLALLGVKTIRRTEYYYR